MHYIFVCSIRPVAEGDVLAEGICVGVVSSGFVPSSLLLCVLGQGHFTLSCLSYPNSTKRCSGPPVFVSYFIHRSQKGTFK